MTKRTEVLALMLLAGSLVGPATAQDQTDGSVVAESFPDHLRYIYTNRKGGPADASGQLLADRKMWQAGDQLKVCFFGGNPVVRNLIASVATQWNPLSSVKLDFGQAGKWRDCMDASAGFSQIRVGFGDRGYWSAIGTDSNNLLNAMQPSMNFEGFDTRYGPYQPTPRGELYTNANVVANVKPYDHGVILHEFGHAFGLMHEHQNPSLDCYNEIKWDGENNAYSYYAGPPNFWDRQKVDFNIGQQGLSGISIKPGQPDPKSIMMYAQPAAIFKTGAASKCYVQPNNDLSVLDKQFIAQIYPLGAVTPSDGPLAATPLPALSSAIASSPSSQNDILERVNADLLSDVTSIRREARRQLASLLQASRSPQLASDLVKGSVGKSYRHQLGVTTALSNTTLPFSSTPAVKEEILQQLLIISKANKDASLARSLSQAEAAVNGQKVQY